MPLLPLPPESEASQHSPSPMLPCTCTVPLTWYRRRWKSATQKRPWPDRKSSKSDLAIQNLGRLNPSRENFQQTLKMLAENGHPELIPEEFAVAIQSESFALNKRDFMVGISTCGRSKLWQDACWLLNKMPEAKTKKDAFAYNAAISACEKGGQWQQALNLFEAMPKAKVAPDVISYNSTISACEKGGEWQKALKLFEVMPKAKVAPDVISYSAAISACEQGGEWQQALKLFEAMPKAKVAPHVISYNSTISACEKGDEWQKALELFEAMPKANVAPDVISYSAAISACKKGGEWQQALKLFDSMLRAKVAPTVISYTAAISACKKVGEWQQALKLFDSMPNAKLLPNIVTYNALLDCREIGRSQSIGGHIFQHGLLKILQGTSVFQDLKVDLHGHSEGAVRLTLQWWLSTTVAKRLEVSERLECIVVTGYGKSRQAWNRTSVQAAALDLLKGLKLDAQILRENLVTSKG